MRHFDRNKITIWASEKNSVMKKCKKAVSAPFPSALSSQQRLPEYLGNSALGQVSWKVETMGQGRECLGLKHGAVLRLLYCRY